ncbi:SRPBCC family protein [Streptacidiphilus jiangxiensis]|uniref:Polyketide cyclase / dehydrase and lipid transport n=1 Tax=Streptacidiphilus jiangxiensis TaxID=235985 RepID=A0A1H7H9C3_STRJI|nr:SRPBCC family protein [Streptacidiphilus jiangxiensis]SEK46818.1 Polyketide cyclase / dehydrase and lipid transport [Streptacidiphilus jiangxiensis]
MAQRQRLIEYPPSQVWDTLADGESYAQWVVGTKEILHADSRWPAVGAQLRFRAGLGPWTFEDTCEVRICESARRLELEASAKPFGTVRIAFTLIPWARNTLVILDEHPLRGLGARLQGPPTEFALHLRNRQLLDNLARTAARAR